MTGEPGIKEGTGRLIPPAYLQEFVQPISDHLAMAMLRASAPKTPEERAAARAEQEEAAGKRRAEAEAEHAAALAAAHEVLRPILEHHRPHVDTWSDYPYCEGCDGGGGYEDEPTGWPCSTYELARGLAAN